jgi:hypothetical protein
MTLPRIAEYLAMECPHAFAHSGSGVLSADGGEGHLPAGGGGGGGRIAVYYNSNSFTGTISAKGGNGFLAGGAGTVYLKQNNTAAAMFIADNGGLSGTNTLIELSGSALSVHVGPGAVLRRSPGFSSPLTFQQLTVASNATFQFAGVSQLIVSNAYVAPDGQISGDGQGFGALQVPADLRLSARAAVVMRGGAE